jgi:preprotein translocase subunit SecA
MFPHGIRARLTALAGGPTQRRLAQWALRVPQVAALEPELTGLADDQLRKRSLALRYRARTGEPLERLLPEAYGLVREAARRRLGLRHYDVQVLGGIALFHRAVIEMQTGEGKTLTATLPAYLRALAGRGVHVLTANDYLAARDAQWMRPVYETLGLSVGVIQQPLAAAERRAAYRCDVTYATASEVGFDFLRDRLQARQRGEVWLPPGGTAADPLSAATGVQRAPYFALVDEADSILIDEARTPLVISAPASDAERVAAACFRWAAPLGAGLQEGEHYDYDHERRAVDLTAAGRQAVRRAEKPPALDSVGLVTLYEHAERAVRVARDYRLDREYVLRDGKIVIVDEYTGRPAEGRQWRDGIHQAVEAKEGVEVTFPTRHAAQITVQDLLLRYEHLAGMTGTAADAARELRRIYNVRVVVVPTNRPPQRRQLPTRVLRERSEKWQAIVQEVRELHAAGRPVLIGTRSIDKSEELSARLAAAGIEHQVLNARHLAREAQIVSEAGQRGRVTVATNMAGRGTDIHLGEGVTELGGLHVVCTERHDSARIDRQLIGRCGRQGDPGTYRVYLSLDDDLLREGLGPEQALAVVNRNRQRSDLAGLEPQFRRAQRSLERRHYRSRRLLMYHNRERSRMLEQMGQDPYLDVAE